MIRRHGELLYGLAPCIAALQAKRRKIYAVYTKPGSLEKRTASKRHVTRADVDFGYCHAKDSRKNILFGGWVGAHVCFAHSQGFGDRAKCR